MRTAGACFTAPSSRATAGADRTANVYGEGRRAAAALRLSSRRGSVQRDAIDGRGRAAEQLVLFVFGTVAGEDLEGVPGRAVAGRGPVRREVALEHAPARR